MILQALTQYYETMVEQGEDIAPLGWSNLRVSYAVELDDYGVPKYLFNLQTEETRGKKTVFVPQEMLLPAPVNRSSNVRANFLCDHSGYMLGIDNKGKQKRTQECFAACRKLHEELLKDVHTSAAKALLRFFQTWEPSKTAESPIISEYLEELISGVNLVFRYRGAYIHNDPEIRAAWDRYYAIPGDGKKMVCLVTGEKCVPEEVHPSIKRVAGAQSSGAALVSFNAPAFCSYGREQSINAPTGRYAAFAYTTALNYLLADREHVNHIGDTTVVCWAGNGASAYQNLFGGMLYGSNTPYTAVDIEKMVRNLVRGMPVLYNDTRLDPNMDFYILGLSPNAARLSVRFFLHNSFGGFLENVQAHYDRLAICRPAYDKFETLLLWKLLSETVNLNSRDKSPSQELAGETLCAILNNTRYPASLLNGVTLRIRAEREITRGRAAIIKAYYMKNPHQDVPKEVLQMSLNPESTNIPYTLGRFFSILEAIQSAANPDINTTIKDKYFNSASATPSIIFPILINLSQKHLRKLDGGLRVFYEKQLMETLDKLQEDFPAHMSLPQQGAFQLGYYHQTQVRFQKKGEK